MPQSSITIRIRADVEEAHQNERNDIFNVVQMIATDTFNIRIRFDHHGRFISSEGKILRSGKRLDEKAKAIDRVVSSPIQRESYALRRSFDAGEHGHAHHFHDRCRRVESKISEHRIVYGIVKDRHDEQ